MFTDVVGYTSMSSKDETTALELLRRYRTLLQSVFPKYEGRVVKTMGDGFLVEFASAVEAVNCAGEAQNEMAKLNSSLAQDQRIQIRIGIHVGDIVHAGEDVLGDAVNVASRVEPLAEPGGIAVTRQVVDQVEGKVRWRIESMGKRTLRNLPNPVEVFRIANDRLPPAGGSSRELDRRRLAILPLANLSADPNDRYFTDGMTEELISTVTGIRELSVISRASAMKYRDSSLPMEQIARELGVEAILEGSVRKAGNRVRISAQLIEVDTDRYVWSQSYDRDLIDVLGVQGDIAQQVAQGLRVQLLSRDKERLGAKPTRSPEAFNLYLKGRFLWNERTEDGVKKAVRYFEEALKADPRFPRAFTGLADSYEILADYGWMAPAAAGALAKENAMKALEIDDSLAEAHASLGLVSVNHDWDFAKGRKEYERALELNPSYVPAYHWYSVLLNFLRKYEEAVQMIRHAAALDPYSLVIRQSIGVSLMGAGRYEEALEQLESVRDENPDLPSIHYWLSLVHLCQGRHAEAIEENIEEVRADHNDPGAKLDLAFSNSEAGRKAEAAKVLDEVVAEKQAYYSPCSVGIALLSLGREGEAFEWMERAFAERDSSILYFRSVPAYDRYSASPRWAELEMKNGLR
jgi:class 3 adenylate cyclase/tetratricopeptide (TPR) repeat protein